MAADIRITYHIRRWRLRRHLGQAALGAQVGLGKPRHEFVALRHFW